MLTDQKTVVLGASNNPSRYSYTACQMLYDQGMEFEPVGIKKGKIFGKEILSIFDHPAIDNVDTVTLYINPIHQGQHYEFILSLNPRRIIFNPGTENTELRDLARQKGIETEYSCTLVLLSTGRY